MPAVFLKLCVNVHQKDPRIYSGHESRQSHLVGRNQQWIIYKEMLMDFLCLTSLHATTLFS